MTMKRLKIALTCVGILGILASAAIAVTFITKDSRSLQQFTPETGQIICTVPGRAYPIPFEAEALSFGSLSTNTGQIFWGSVTTTTIYAGAEMTAGQSVTLGGQGFYLPANTVYVVSTVAGNRVWWARLY